MILINRIITSEENFNSSNYYYVVTFFRDIIVILWIKIRSVYNKISHFCHIRKNNSEFLLYSEIILIHWITFTSEQNYNSSNYYYVATFFRDMIIILWIKIKSVYNKNPHFCHVRKNKKFRIFIIFRNNFNSSNYFYVRTKF